jgi:hypothetical protein
MSLPQGEGLDTEHGGTGVLGGPLRYPPNDMVRYYGRHISTICQATIAKQPGYNHCAHFVCHVMHWNHLGGALKCDLTYKVGSTACCVRVNEVFNVAPDRGTWAAGEELDDNENLLIVATVRANVISHPDQPPMLGMHDQKPIGLLTRGRVWHYTTMAGRVMGQEPEAFRHRMRHAYGASTVFFRSGLVRL